MLSAAATSVLKLVHLNPRLIQGSLHQGEGAFTVECKDICAWMTRRTLTMTDKQSPSKTALTRAAVTHRIPPDLDGGAHMWPINTPIRAKSRWDHAFQLSLHHPCQAANVNIRSVRARDGVGMIILRDLTDERVLFCL